MCRAATPSPAPIRPMPCSLCWAIRRRSGRRLGSRTDAVVFAHAALHASWEVGQMTLRVVGAGVGRTGTRSLQLALEQLLGGRCYHMAEVFDQPGHVELWHRAVRGSLPDWDQLLAGYEAAVD